MIKELLLITLLLFCQLSLNVEVDGSVKVKSIDRIVAYNSLIREEKYDYRFNEEDKVSGLLDNFILIFSKQDSGRFISFRAILDDNKLELDITKLDDVESCPENNICEMFTHYLVHLPRGDEVRWEKLSVFVAYASAPNSPAMDERLPIHMGDVSRIKTPVGTYCPYEVELQTVSFLDMYNVKMMNEDIGANKQEVDKSRSQHSSIVRAHLSEDSYIPSRQANRKTDNYEYLYGFEDEKLMDNINTECFTSGVVLGYAEAYSTNWTLRNNKEDLVTDPDSYGREVGWRIKRYEEATKVTNNDPYLFSTNYGSLYMIFGVANVDVAISGKVVREMQITRGTNTYAQGKKTTATTTYTIANVKDSYDLVNKRPKVLSAYKRSESKSSVRSVSLIVFLLDRIPLMHRAYDSLGRIYVTSVKDVLGKIGQSLRPRYEIEGGFKSKFTTERIEEIRCVDHMDSTWGGSVGYVCAVELVCSTFPVIDLESVDTYIHVPYMAKGLFVNVDGVRFELDSPNPPQHPSMSVDYPTFPNCQVKVEFETEYGFLEVFSGHHVVHITKGHCLQRDTSGDRVEVGYYTQKALAGNVDVGFIAQFMVPFTLFALVVSVLKLMQ